MCQSTLGVARSELTHLLGAVVNCPWDSLAVALDVDPSLPPGQVRVESQPSAVRIVGGEPADVLHGVYNFLEELGYVFTVSGPIAPERVYATLPTLAKTYRPYLQRRGIRQHINFPMDISSYPLWEAKAYIRNLARMRFNAITFHMYLSCGWYHLQMPELGDSFAERPGRIHDYTYFYSEYHPVPNEPHLKRVIRNEHSFCPPEVESRYGTTDARPFAYTFLRELIAQAKQCGMSVTVSTDIAGSNFKEAFPHAAKHDRELWVRATLEMLNQMTALYGDADDFELISPENVAKDSSAWRDDCCELVQRLMPQWTTNDIDALLAMTDDAGQGERATFLQVLECIDVALETFRRAKASPTIAPRLRNKKLTVALYNGRSSVSRANAKILTSAVPSEYDLAWLPAHGAGHVQANIDRMELTSADRERFRLYSWVEVDGYMYTPQFPRTGLKANIDFATNAGNNAQSRGVLFNHWRNSENDLGLLFAAHAAYAGIASETFAAKTLKAYWGVEDETLLNRFLDTLEQIDTLNSMCGFCYLACWWEVDAEKKMIAARVSKEDRQDNQRRIATTQQAIAWLDQLMAASRRPVAIPRMRFQRAVLSAAIAHHHCVNAMGDMAEWAATLDRNALTREQRQHFQQLGDVALTHANAWLSIMADHCVDRGVEGNIVSYHHVVVGYIKGFQGIYGTISYEPMPEYGVPTAIQAPPPLLS